MMVKLAPFRDTILCRWFGRLAIPIDGPSLLFSRFVNILFLRRKKRPVLYFKVIIAITIRRISERSYVCSFLLQFSLLEGDRV
jgi:hypothetical protein